jgi:hypothetical protein
VKPSTEVEVHAGDTRSRVVVRLPGAGPLVPHAARGSLGPSDDAIRLRALRTPEAGLAAAVRATAYTLPPSPTVVVDRWSSLVPPPHPAFDAAAADTLAHANRHGLDAVSVEITVSDEPHAGPPSPLLTLLPAVRRAEMATAGMSITVDDLTHRIAIPRALLGRARFDAPDAVAQGRTAELLRAPLAVAQVLPVLDSYVGTRIAAPSGGSLGPGLVITAWNPFSTSTAAEENEAAQLRLHRRLLELGCSPREVLAGGPGWQEPSFWVGDLDVARGCDLGREFQQAAVFVLAEGHRDIVLCATGDVLDVSGGRGI